METKISSIDEKNLTQAIESAATVASVDPSLDRSQLLATHLNKAGVDKRFAKIASSAFNKRLTVLTFQQTDDDHKADSFPLSDGDKVSELMGGTTSKTASCDRSFFISAEKTATMQKAASAAPVSYGKKPLEDRLEYTDYLDVLEGTIDKQAKCFQQINFELRSKEDCLEKLASEIVHDFERNDFGFDFRTAVNYFGNSFTNIIKDMVPSGTNLVKAASAIKMNTPMFAKIAHCIALADYIDATKQFIGEYGAGLGQFAKAASDFSEAIRKAELDGSLSKIASPSGLLAGGALKALPLYTMAATDAVGTIGGAVADSARTGFGNAYDLMRSKDIDASPAKAVDAEFLLKDRMRDRMMAWSDMVADPQFSIYPSEQVFQATNKAMNTDTMMERGDKRELLRATVAQLLAQNNRLGSADLAALATTLKGLSVGAGHGASIAGSSVGAMDKVRAADTVVLGSIIEKARPSSSARDAVKSILTSMTDDAKNYAALQEAEKKEQTRIKERDEDRADKSRMHKETLEQQERDSARKDKTNRDAIKAKTLLQKRDLKLKEEDNIRRDRTNRSNIALHGSLERKRLNMQQSALDNQQKAIDSHNKNYRDYLKALLLVAKKNGGSSAGITPPSSAPSLPPTPSPSPSPLPGPSAPSGPNLGSWTTDWLAKRDYAAKKEAKKRNVSIDDILALWAQQKGNQVRMDQQLKAEKAGIV